MDDQSSKTGMSRESAVKFHVAKVQKPLALAAKLVEARNRIPMGPNPCDNYIENTNTGERIGLRVERGTFVFDVGCCGGEHGTITCDSGAGGNVFPEELQKAVPTQPRDPRLRMTAAAHGHQDHSVPRTGAGFHEAGVSTNSALRPREVCKVGAVSEREGAGEKPDDGEDEGRKPQKMQNPLKPSEAEVGEHNLTHLPHSSWCRHCVRRRGKEMPRRQLEDEASMPEVRRSRRWRQRFPRSPRTHVARRIVAFLREIGLALGDLLVRHRPGARDAGRVRAAEGGGRYVVEQSPVGSSASNGLAERAILSVEQQARVLKSAVDTRSCRGVSQWAGLLSRICR